jgi:hypothetical protein
MFSPGNAAGPARASSHPPLPRERPTWMVVLATVMVVFAFYLFLEGAAGLTRGPAELVPPPAGVAPAAPGTPEAAEQALRRSLVTVLQAVDPTLLRLYAGVKLVFAAALIYAVAAIVTRDRRGRRGALVAAWVGIGYHLLVAAFFIAVVRTGLLEASGAWVDAVVVAMAARPDAQALTAQEIRAWADALLVVVAVAGGLVGVGFSLILIAFFGGGRGRAYYGVPARGVPATGEARPGV